MKKLVKKIPILGNLASQLYIQLVLPLYIKVTFPGSKIYWEKRYAIGGSSGAGSYGELSKFKAEIINSFIKKHNISTVIEFGCGDGNQLSLARYEQYLGIDVSKIAISLCKAKFSTDVSKTFKHLSEYNDDEAELALSLDVIYHLIEDRAFKNHVNALFSSASRFVIIYSSNSNVSSKFTDSHVKHRKFTEWIDKKITGWELRKLIPNKYPYDKHNLHNGSFASFYIYEKT